MQYCSCCGRALLPGEQFCGWCGASVARMTALLSRKTCAACGYADERDPRRCPRCGGNMKFPELMGQPRSQNGWIRAVAIVLAVALLGTILIFALQALRRAFDAIWFVSPFDDYGYYDEYDEYDYYDFLPPEPSIMPTLGVL